MGVRNVVKLDVRPSQRSHLAFDVEGVLGEFNVELGQSVTAFDLASFYAGLGATVAGAPAELQYGSAEIQRAMAGSTLMALRAEARKAALDSAVAARVNAYYGKYGSQAAIIALINRFYAPASPGLEAGPARRPGRDLPEPVRLAAGRLRGRRPPGGDQVHHERTCLHDDQSGRLRYERHRQDDRNRCDEWQQYYQDHGLRQRYNRGEREIGFDHHKRRLDDNRVTDGHGRRDKLGRRHRCSDKHKPGRHRQHWLSRPEPGHHQHRLRLPSSEPGKPGPE